VFEIYRNSEFHLAESLYWKEPQRFPFIGAVLNGTQRGRVWVDDPANPLAAFVCHDFGWAQLFGDLNHSFIESLTRFLFIDEEFSSPKLRIFAPSGRATLSCDGAQISERRQFRLPLNISTVITEKSLARVVKISRENAHEVSRALNLELFSRNWPSVDAFTLGGFGFVVYVGDEPVSACYACASMGNIVEIDVATVERHRGKGFARTACEHFIIECHERKLIPNWDCFTNNLGSMALNKALGFLPLGAAVPFITFNRRR
jgi:hypothetical protein